MLKISITALALITLAAPVPATEVGDKNTYIESITALSAQVVGNLALVASYTVRHNTDVLPLTEKTDTFTALSLEYRF